MGRILGRLWYDLGACHTVDPLLTCGVRVGLTLFLITFIAYSSQVFVFWPWFGRELSVPLTLALGPFKYDNRRLIQ